MAQIDDKKYELIDNTDHWKTEDLLEIIDIIHNSGSCVEERQDRTKEKYAEFIKRYPMLFTMACENSYDKDTLKYMMNMRNRVLNDECSVESASRVVGNKFFGKYVSPVVDNLNSNKKAKHTE
jgi:hypothetical protein